MTTFDERERAFENKFARDEEMTFRIIARRNRLMIVPRNAVAKKQMLIGVESFELASGSIRPIPKVLRVGSMRKQATRSALF